jgi:hypothetical protein
MGYRGFLLVLFVLIFAGCPSFAQERLLMGKMVDENNKPIAGAIIKVGKGSGAVETRSDIDGLYYTTLLPSGTYHIAVECNGKFLKAKKIYFYAEGPKKYYALTYYTHQVRNIQMQIYGAKIRLFLRFLSMVLGL